MFNSNLLAPLFLGAALTTLASVTPLPASIHPTDPSLSVTNVSLNADVPDPRFSVSHLFGPPLLPIVPCLMNVLYFMSEIAYGDFTQRHQPKTYRVPDYDEVEISTEVATCARFLIWGVWLAMEYMIANNRFQDVVWTLSWERTIVGTIRIQPSAPRTSLPSNNNSSNYNYTHLLGISSIIADNTASRAEPPILTKPNISNQSLLDSQLVVEIESFTDSKPLTKYEVFMICYTGLLYCAQMPTEVTMQSFNTKSPIDDVSLHLYK